jgi:hypothetical protein
VHTHDSAARRADQAPLVLAGDRIRIELPQVPAHARIARVLEQFGEPGARVAAVASRAAVQIAGNRLPIRSPHFEQPLLGLTPLHDAAEGQRSARRQRQDGDQDQQPEIGETGLAAASASAKKRSRAWLQFGEGLAVAGGPVGAALEVIDTAPTPAESGAISSQVANYR